MDDIENWVSRYTDRDEPEERTCMGCGFVDCECDDDQDDCLNCGVCDWCIERSITAAEENRGN